MSEDFETDEVRKEMSMSTEVKLAPVQFGLFTRNGIVTLIEVSDSTLKRFFSLQNQKQKSNNSKFPFDNLNNQAIMENCINNKSYLRSNSDSEFQKGKVTFFSDNFVKFFLENGDR